MVAGKVVHFQLEHVIKRFPSLLLFAVIGPFRRIGVIKHWFPHNSNTPDRSETLSEATNTALMLKGCGEVALFQCTRKQPADLAGLSWCVRDQQEVANGSWKQYWRRRFILDKTCVLVPATKSCWWEFRGGDRRFPLLFVLTRVRPSITHVDNARNEMLEGMADTTGAALTNLSACIFEDLRDGSFQRRPSK